MPKEIKFPGDHYHSFNSDIRTVTGVPTSITAFLGRTPFGIVNEPILINSFTEFEKNFGGMQYDLPLTYAVRDFFINGGSRAVIVRLFREAGNIEKPFSDYEIKFNVGKKNGILTVEDYLGSEVDQTGIYALEKTDIFNLLCIPPDRRQENIFPEVYREALRYCVNKKAMLIVDPPLEWTFDRETVILKTIAGLDDLGLSDKAGENAAIYFPLVAAPDPLMNGEEEIFVPCGIIAGLISSEDKKHGVWKAPAGSETVITGINRLNISLNDEEISELNRIGVNCMRSLPSGEIVVWGSRTLKGGDQYNDEYKYIPVRRLALYIEESIYQGTEWVVFEPNDEPLWEKIRLYTGTFLHSLYTSGAFPASKPEEAYFIRCDRTTMTQEDVDNGTVNIVVGFAPVKPAEFIIINIRQIAGKQQ